MDNIEVSLRGARSAKQSPGHRRTAMLTIALTIAERAGGDA
jgi:hypothetical protein